MKKMYALLFLFLAASLVGCGIKAPVVIDAELTGEVEEIEIVEEIVEETEEELEGPSDEEIENFDANEVPVVDGNEEVAAETISDEVKSFISKINVLIKQRKTQPKDESKLTEEDIDLMEKVIEELKNL